MFVEMEGQYGASTGLVVRGQYVRLSRHSKAGNGNQEESNFGLGSLSGLGQGQGQW